MAIKKYRIVLDVFHETERSDDLPILYPCYWDWDHIVYRPAVPRLNGERAELVSCVEVKATRNAPI